jgi:hypothetical protein
VQKLKLKLYPLFFAAIAVIAASGGVFRSR